MAARVTAAGARRAAAASRSHLRCDELVAHGADDAFEVVLLRLEGGGARVGAGIAARECRQAIMSGEDLGNGCESDPGV